MTLPWLKNRVTGPERTFLARQLATMLSSGLAIDRAIAVLANQVQNPYLRQVLNQIQTDLEAGLAFSTAIGKHPRIFSRVFVNVIVAGEAVGKVAEVLQDMATRLEKQQEFVARIRAALYYPVFVVITIVIVGVIMMVRVVPQLKSVFEEAGVALPLTTQLMITVSEFLANQWWVALIILVVGLLGLRAYLASGRGQLVLDYLAIKFPTGIARDFYMARFSQTLALLTQSGTPIIEAIGITAEVINNRFYAQVLEETKEEIARGIPMSVPISKSDLFPMIVPQMILVGEQTGRLDQILASLADYFEEETDLKLKALSSLFEPAMIVLVGVVVAFLVFAVFVPLYNIARFG